jgi:protein-S-isoprenylcysteine O-methyltransferase Ste14
MGFRERWINLLHRTATSTKKTRTLLTPIGVTIFCLFTALFVLAAIFVDRLLDLPRLLPEGVRLPVSIPVIAVGVAVTAWSVFHFLKVKGTPVPFNPPPIEEPDLMKRLGDEYIEYRRQTPMFIPGRRPKSNSNA